MHVLTRKLYLALLRSAYIRIDRWIRYGIVKLLRFGSLYWQSSQENTEYFISDFFLEIERNFRLSDHLGSLLVIRGHYLWKYARLSGGLYHILFIWIIPT